VNDDEYCDEAYFEEMVAWLQSSPTPEAEQVLGWHQSWVHVASVVSLQCCSHHALNTIESVEEIIHEYAVDLPRCLVSAPDSNALPRSNHEVQTLMYEVHPRADQHWPATARAPREDPFHSSLSAAAGCCTPWTFVTCSKVFFESVEIFRSPSLVQMNLGKVSNEVSYKAQKKKNEKKMKTKKRIKYKNKKKNHTPLDPLLRLVVVLSPCPPGFDSLDMRSSAAALFLASWFTTSSLLHPCSSASTVMLTSSSASMVW